MAKRFRFPLQTLLNVRQLHEREAKRRVGAKASEIARLDGLRAQTTVEVGRQQEVLLSAQQQGALNPLELQRGRAWIAHLRKTSALLGAQRVELANQLQELQVHLRAARTQTRIIEKLRARRWQAYRKDRDRREQATADDLARQLQPLGQSASPDKVQTEC
jgi:flagellar export protein FliJ